MKSIYFILFFISCLISGQIENFILDDNQVKWQKIYETSNNITKIENAIKDKNGLKITEKGENYFEGEIINLVMQYKLAGFSLLNTPEELSDDNKFYGFFRIDFKDGKYRVIVRNVYSKGATYTYMIGNIGFDENLDTTLEKLALDKKNQFRKKFINKSSKIIDTTFSNLFEFKFVETTKENDDW